MARDLRSFMDNITGTFANLPFLATMSDSALFSHLEGKSMDEVTNEESRMMDFIGGEEEDIFTDPIIDDPDAIDKVNYQMANPRAIQTPYGPALATEQMDAILDQYNGLEAIVGLDTEAMDEMFAEADKLVDDPGFLGFFEDIDDYAMSQGQNVLDAGMEAIQNIGAGIENLFDDKTPADQLYAGDPMSMNIGSGSTGDEDYEFNLSDIASGLVGGGIVSTLKNVIDRDENKEVQATNSLMMDELNREYGNLGNGIITESSFVTDIQNSIAEGALDSQTVNDWLNRNENVSDSLRNTIRGLPEMGFSDSSSDFNMSLLGDDPYFRGMDRDFWQQDQETMPSGPLATPVPIQPGTVPQIQTQPVPQMQTQPDTLAGGTESQGIVSDETLGIEAAHMQTLEKNTSAGTTAAKFWNTVYSLPESGRPDIQKQLPSLRVRTETLFWLYEPDAYDMEQQAESSGDWEALSEQYGEFLTSYLNNTTYQTTTGKMIQAKDPATFNLAIAKFSDVVRKMHEDPQALNTVDPTEYGWATVLMGDKEKGLRDIAISARVGSKTDWRSQRVANALKSYMDILSNQGKSEYDIYKIMMGTEGQTQIEPTTNNTQVESLDEFNDIDPGNNLGDPSYPRSDKPMSTFQKYMNDPNFNPNEGDKMPHNKKVTVSPRFF